MKFADILNEVEAMVAKGGPDPNEYNDVTRICDQLMKRNMSLEEEGLLYEKIKPLMSLNSMLGFSFLKPHGYAGDHELIDRIYQSWHSPDSQKFHKWDSYYHNLNAPQAVRNRKDYLKEQLFKLTTDNEKKKVLNLASGPCTDLYEYFISSPRSNIEFDCLDLDPNSLEYGAAICDAYAENIQFIHRNAFRYSTTTRYNLIWSAGLFDYFSDKLFVRLVNRMYALLAEEGELVVGNFSPDNTSKGFMEILCKWYLHHRDEEHLTKLAIQAGIPSNKIVINSEQTGTNLFMHMRK